MIIVTISLGSAFTEGMTYQDNLLANQLKADGNEVTVIADCFKYKNGILVKTKEEDKILDNGMRLIRIKYKNILGGFISGKIRAVKGLYGILENKKPDIIFHHGLYSIELLTVAKYKKNNPEVKVYVDSHADFYNSATNFFSKNILHKIFYKGIIYKSLPYIDKVFCVSYESIKFLKEIYNISNKKIEFYPLGGVVLNKDIRSTKRKMIRKELGLNNNDVLLIHTGKMNKHKRTEVLLKAFIQVTSNHLHLVLIGSLSKEIKINVRKLTLTNKRIKFLGWKSGDELTDYLCACDLYMQPGTQSATIQNAACCMSALAVYPYPSYDYLFRDSVFYIKNENDIVDLLGDIVNNPKILEKKRLISYKIAEDKLDYKVLAKKLYQ